ncbi:MAG: DNA polymerase IV, partial [Thermodesulfobacteriota bacterium]
MSRTIMHIDMNAFFASVEQRCNPALRGRAIAVIGSAKRTVVTTASYEARRYGVKTGMNRYEAERVCPGLIFVIGDNRKYIDTSIRILDILKEFSPMLEVYSIDEAFIDITGSIGLFGPPRLIAKTIKKRIKEGFGLTCSIGIAPNKLLAKLASNMEKPDGLVKIEEGDIPGLLEDLPVGDLWGIGRKLTIYLKEMGVETCGQLGRCPVSLLRRRFGIIGERMRFMGRGVDDSPVIPIGEEEEAKSVGHS